MTTAVAASGITKIEEYLGQAARGLLDHASKGIPKTSLHLPGPRFVDEVWTASDRPAPVLRSLQTLFDHGRLAGTGYLSILPVDQGIEHSAGASFAKNPLYFDPENIVKLAIEGGCNAVASTFGVLGAVARKYAHHIPFIVKFNHNEFLTYPNKFDQIMFGTIKQAWDMGAVAVGATIYFGSDESARQIVEVSPGVPGRPRAGHGDGPVVLPAQPSLQEGQGLPRVRRPHRPGEPPRRHDRGRHHQAEAAGEQRRLQGAQQQGESVRQDRQAHLHRALERPPDRPLPLPGRELLHGPGRPHQQRRRLGRQRLRRSREDRRHQQARRRHGPHLRPQSLPAPDGRRREAAATIQDVYLCKEVTIA